MMELPFRKTMLKRRHGGATEAPICARASNKRSLAWLPSDIGTHVFFGFQRNKLCCVSDDENRKPTTDSTTHAKTLGLPADFCTYNKRPWRCFRDVMAAAHFKAEGIRARAEARAFDIDCAMSALVLRPFAWDTTECFNDRTVFVIWASGETNNIQYHLKAAGLRRLCEKAGAYKKASRAE